MGEDRRSEKSGPRVICCHANGHTIRCASGGRHPGEFRHRLIDPAGVNIQRLFGSQRALKTVEDFTEFEQRAACAGSEPGDCDWGQYLERGSQGPRGEFRRDLDFPPTPKLNIYGQLWFGWWPPLNSGASALFSGAGPIAVCHPAVHRPPCTTCGPSGSAPRADYSASDGVGGWLIGCPRCAASDSPSTTTDERRSAEDTVSSSAVLG